MSSASYSSLFTAGLFAHRGESSAVPPPINTTETPNINVRGPSPVSPSSNKQTNPAPRRRRKSSVTIGSSPMSAIKSPVQRVHFAQRSAQRSFSIIVTSPNRAATFPDVPEGPSSLMRNRRGRAPPPLQKPAPDRPLPELPLLPFTESNNTRPAIPRRDSEVLPLPSPTFLFGSRPAQPSVLAPSPDIDHLSIPRPRSADKSSSTILGALDETEEMATGETMTLHNEYDD